MSKKVRFTLLATLLISVANLSSAADRLNAESFDLDNYRGKVLYLDFWASWCGPCRASFPWMNNLRQAYGEDELAIVAINVDTNRGQAEQFLSELGADFDVVFDQAGSLPPDFEVMGMPSAYLYSADGELLASHIGFRQSDADEWRKTVDSALEGGVQ